MPGKEAYPRAKAAAQAAIDRDDLVVDAHAVLGYSLSAYDWDPVAAERELGRALALDPNSANAHELLGTYLCSEGRTDEALPHLDRAGRLDPLSPLPSYMLEYCLYFAHRYDEAIAAHRKTQEIAPGFWYTDSYEAASYRELGNYEAAVRSYAESAKSLGGQPQFGLAITYARMGRTKEARDILRQLDDWARTHYVPLMVLAAVHGSVGDKDAAVALLQRSLDARELMFLSGAHSPEMAPLLDDPRVKHLLAQATPLKQTKP
jgi:serine/threonine-protein kinase